LITKKGNKTNVRAIDVPKNAYLAVKTRERISAEEEEREQIKEQIRKIQIMQNNYNDKSGLESPDSDSNNN
jgi:hypothetical protein